MVNNVPLEMWIEAIIVTGLFGYVVFSIQSWLEQDNMLDSIERTLRRTKTTELEKLVNQYEKDFPTVWVKPNSQ
jgi:uncharacterized membrane protein affecting hemolysin expression